MISELIRNLLSNGEVTITTLNGKRHTARLIDHYHFTSDALDLIREGFELRIFDIIVNYLRQQPEYTAKKGNARNFRLGQEKCGRNTLAGIIGYEYFGARDGSSIFDPGFILYAILDYAGVCSNRRGKVTLNLEYRD